MEQFRSLVFQIAKLKQQSRCLKVEAPPAWEHALPRRSNQQGRLRLSAVTEHMRVGACMSSGSNGGQSDLELGE